MSSLTIPDTVLNLIAGKECAALTGEVVEKLNPADGKVLCRLTRSGATEVEESVRAAQAAQASWAVVPAVTRGLMLHNLVLGLQRRREEIASIVHMETGKSMKDALGETDGAIQCGLFYAGEGQRLYGRTCTSGAPDKYAMTVRRPVGVAGLIIAANTPIANVAWKIFPALVCGNAAVLKAAEDAPATAWIFGRIAAETGLPAGVLNIIQGLGQEAGVPLVAHNDVGVISFTGSTAVGRQIAEVAGRRLAKVSLELGGKNPLVICDDADLDKAVRWTVLSAFSNAGQRCAAGSRIIVFDKVYKPFRERLLAAVKTLKVGIADDDDFGPVINQRQLQNILAVIDRACSDGAVILTGGHRLKGAAHTNGFYLEPTVIEAVAPDAEISVTELFGPVCCLYRVPDFEGSLALANDSPYGLTACIHTRSLDRAMEFSYKVASGVSVVNAGTYGSEPHMPFGGVKQSGNGSREPGTEALDIYSDLKDVYLNLDPKEA